MASVTAVINKPFIKNRFNLSKKISAFQKLFIQNMKNKVKKERCKIQRSLIFVSTYFN